MQSTTRNYAYFTGYIQTELMLTFGHCSTFICKCHRVHGCGVRLSLLQEVEYGCGVSLFVLLYVLQEVKWWNRRFPVLR